MMRALQIRVRLSVCLHHDFQMNSGASLFFKKYFVPHCWICIFELYKLSKGLFLKFKLVFEFFSKT